MTFIPVSRIFGTISAEVPCGIAMKTKSEFEVISEMFKGANLMSVYPRRFGCIR